MLYFSASMKLFCLSSNLNNLTNVITVVSSEEKEDSMKFPVYFLLVFKISEE